MKTKDDLFNEAQQMVDALWIDRHGFGGCIIWAFAAALVLKRAGYKPVVQAGDMQWPVVDVCDDDGKMNTHLAYMWTPHEEKSKLALVSGLLPEMHCWLGLVETQEFIDFSTHDFKNQAARLGVNWTSKQDPPKYLWGKLPFRVLYRPHRDATFFAMSRMAMLANEVVTDSI